MDADTMEAKWFFIFLSVAAVCLAYALIMGMSIEGKNQRACLEAGKTWHGGNYFDGECK